LDIAVVRAELQAAIDSRCEIRIVLSTGADLSFPPGDPVLAVERMAVGLIRVTSKYSGCLLAPGDIVALSWVTTPSQDRVGFAMNGKSSGDRDYPA
jgi:hypothetical protein